MEDYMLIDYHIVGRQPRQRRVTKEEGERILRNREFVKDTLSPHWNRELIELGKKHQSQHLNGLK
jgi:hypothetical protein